MSFSRELFIKHDGSDFKRQDLGCSNIEFNSDNNNAFLGFIRSLDGTILNNRYPLEGVIESGPLFVNSLSYPKQIPNNFVEKIIRTGTNVAIEFRTSDMENVSGATEWKSISVGGGSDNFIKINYNNYSGPFESDGANLISEKIIKDGEIIGFSMLGNSTDCSNDFIFFTSDEVSVPALNTQAKYFSFDIKSDRGGIFLELNVTHGLAYSIEDPLDDVELPFKKVIEICKTEKPQTIFWDITDWPLGERNYDFIRAFSFKVTEASNNFNLLITNIRLFEIDDSTVPPPSGAVAFPADLGRFIQYRVVFSTIEAGITPEVKEVKFDFKHRPAMLPSDLMRHQKFFDKNNMLSYPTRKGLDIVYP